MAAIVLSYADVARLLPMADCVDLMATTLRELDEGRFEQPLRSMIHPQGSGGILGLMPGYRFAPDASWALKAITVMHKNAEKGLDAHQGVVILYDGETGVVQLVANASAVTEIRTAAVSGVATRLLAREDAETLCVVGAGVQARSHLAAMAVARPFSRCLLYSRTRAKAEELAATAATPFPVEVVDSAEEAVRGADVIVTATNSADPVLERAWVADGAHLNVVGSSVATRREVDAATVRDSSLFVDRYESALNEAGDLLIAVAEGAVTTDHIRAELGEILAGKHPGRTSAAEITLFKSLGIAAEDLASAELLLRRAEETGAGVRVEL